MREFYMYGCAGNPLGYTFSWFVRGGLLSLLNDSAYILDGKQVDVAGQDLMAHIIPYAYSPAYNWRRTRTAILCRFATSINP